MIQNQKTTSVKTQTSNQATKLRVRCRWKKMRREQDVKKQAHTKP